MACWSAENATKAYLSTLKMVSNINMSHIFSDHLIEFLCLEFNFNII